jgi:glucose/arabinose dehydrogenase
VTLDRPLALARDGADFLIAGQGGAITRVTLGGDGQWTTVPYGDFHDKLVHDTGEEGLIGFAVSPDYATTHQAFIVYAAPPALPGMVMRTTLARVTATDGKTLDPSTLEILFTVDKDAFGHNGGRIVFGPDRYLYLGIGDGSWGDPLHRAQDLNLPFGKIYRFDVLKGPQGTKPYSIPPDNPFVNGGGMPEIFAYGVRNPWSFSLAPDGRLWLGDVGMERYEEIDIVPKGANLGWPIREASHCFTSSPCDVPGAVDPVYSYPHVDGYAVTGGYVYRGQQAALKGLYVFGDFMTGRIWALDAANPQTAEGQARVLVDSARNISGFGEDGDGEILAIDYGGHVARLQAYDTTPPPVTSLKDLGCVDNPQFTPYDVIAPLWSDGLDKKRWFSFPAGQAVKVQDDGTLELPSGSIMLKEFSSNGKKIETRMLTRDPIDGWLGYTFQWKDDQSDATLIDDATTVDVNGSPWTLPSRGQCFACHRASVGAMLGFVPSQLDVNNQLDALAANHVFDRAVDRESLNTLVNPYDETQPAEARARSYLSANCSFCHGGTGSPEGVMDLRVQIPAAQTYTICRVASGGYDTTGTPPNIIEPGHPELSVLVQRLQATDTNVMPPIGRHVVDTAAVNAISTWITGITGCP